MVASYRLAALAVPGSMVATEEAVPGMEGTGKVTCPTRANKQF